MESLMISILLLCNFVQFFSWAKSFTLEKMKDFVTEILDYGGWKKLWEYVMLHDNAMYKTNEKIEELVTENKMLKSEVETLKSEFDGLIKRLVYLEQKPETPLPKPLKGGKRSR